MKKRKILAAMAAATVPMASTGMVAPAIAHAAEGSGTQLVSEDFDSNFKNDKWVSVGDTCLTNSGCSDFTGWANNAKPAQGWAQLTNAARNAKSAVTDQVQYGNQSGSLLWNQALPSAAGIRVSFDQVQGGGNAAIPERDGNWTLQDRRGADGIGFFLTDGNSNLVRPGGQGGSLGYTQNNDLSNDTDLLPGVNKGVVGLGLDAWGNFINDWQGKGIGSPNPGLHVDPETGQPGDPEFRMDTSFNTDFAPPAGNVLGLRGPGDGTQGYGLLQYKYLDNNFSFRAKDPINSKKRVTVEISPAVDGKATVTALIDGEKMFENEINDVPQTYKFGFSASTGSGTDVHAIRMVRAESINPLDKLTLVKQIDDTGKAGGEKKDVYAVGDKIPYSFTVTNGGSSEVKDLKVVDPALDSPAKCDSTTLGVGGTNSSTTCYGTHTLKEGDLNDEGRFVNTAYSEGNSDTGKVKSNEDSVSVPVKGEPAPKHDAKLSLEKTVTSSKDVYKSGDVVTYNFKVTNTGNSDIKNIAIDDDKAENIKCEATELAPSESTTCTGDHKLTKSEAEDKSGKFVNTARATGDDPDGKRVNSPKDEAEVPVGPDDKPALSVEKTVADKKDSYKAGDTVTYNFKVTNTGNVQVNKVSVKDNKAENIKCEADTLKPSESTSCSGTHKLTSEEASDKSGKFVNTATAVGETPDGTPVESPEDRAEVPVANPQPKLDLEKTVANAKDSYVAGDTINYDFKVTNSGNTTINKIGIKDDRASNISCESDSLAMGESTMCSGSHVLTDTEALDKSGKFVNTATAVGETPDGTPVESPEDRAEVPLNPEIHKIVLNKAVDSNSKFFKDAYNAGDTVPYVFSVTNEGQDSVSDLKIVDNRAEDIKCDSTNLARKGENGSATLCYGTHVLTDEEANGKDFVNVATAEGVSDFDGEKVVSNEAQASVKTIAPAKPPLVRTGIAVIGVLALIAIAGVGLFLTRKGKEKA